MAPPGEAPPRFRLERAARGYRVVGRDLLLWEPTLHEAAGARAELEGAPVRHPPGAALAPTPGEPAWGPVYGPIASRRLGRSLGVNLTPPGCRICTFDCVYCAFGGVPRRRVAAGWPSAAEVAVALAEALPRAGALDSITVSGHGEPTLHPCFAEVADALLGAARRLRPEVPVRILTNGSGVLRPAVGAALDRFDERIVKLDADPERIERPDRRHPLGSLLAALALLRDVTLQSCFVEGLASNTHWSSVDPWIELVAEIRPRAVQIYTIDCRPPHPQVLAAAADLLEEIACRLRARTGIEASVHA